MFYQIEITTHCNFACFYCAGRNLPQRHMAWKLFRSIIDSIPDGRHTVSLQGEGEPFTHPRFWDMVAAIQDRGLSPFTISNGSLLDPVRVSASLPRIGISLDTLDPAEAGGIGRLKPDQVLANLDRLLAAMHPRRVQIFTVDFGQSLQSLRAFLQERGLHLHWIVQKLQTKDDYARRYPQRVSASFNSITLRCRYLKQDKMRFYDVEGREYPCCFIKDPSTHEPIAQIKAKMAAHELPRCCSGCRELIRHA